MPAEIAQVADFSQIRYAQCWEDADILLSALDIQPAHICLSVASAGDNTLAMLSRSPKKVIAVDLNPAQIACLELRVAAYRQLSHPELLELIGSVPAAPAARINLYRRCRNHLSAASRQFWDERPNAIATGTGSAGKFERYLTLFRRYILPLTHSSDKIAHTLKKSLTPEDRQTFYTQHWNNWQWQLLFRLFFSRFVLGRFGRDPSFFQYVKAGVAEHLLERTRYALTDLNPAENPYLQWIATGQHITALPCALRPENFQPIRANLDRLEWHCTPLEDFLETSPIPTLDRYNLSNVFEYMSPQNYHRVLEQLIRAGRPGSRIAYWNLLAERLRPESMANRLRPLTELSSHLYRQDKAFFYSAFILEEII
ncbi:DUF3419 family protein [Kamptonema formosum]|uniref:DUF3419 family protein n=1 Tax=Kamptonema formosum TaxID=331992 RepID=UPI00034613E2|nr:DUF3419 family protein [Oscillatoria sp. PCC 10802]